MKQIFKLLKNIFSKEPFDQEIIFEFSIYDAIFGVLILIWIIWIILK